jgi:hypothetical protein
MSDFIDLIPGAGGRRDLIEAVVATVQADADRAPILIGRVEPEAVVLSLSLFERLKDIIDLMLAADQAMRRLELDGGDGEDNFAAFCYDMGVDPASVAIAEGRNVVSGFDPVAVEQW